MDYFRSLPAATPPAELLALKQYDVARSSLVHELSQMEEDEEEVGNTASDLVGAADALRQKAPAIPATSIPAPSFSASSAADEGEDDDVAE
jgi:hypothetical protein